MLSACPRGALVPLQARALKQAVNQATDAASQAKLDVSTLQQESEQLQDQVVQVRQSCWLLWSEDVAVCMQGGIVCCMSLDLTRCV